VASAGSDRAAAGAPSGAGRRRRGDTDGGGRAARRSARVGARAADARPGERDGRRVLRRRGRAVGRRAGAVQRLPEREGPALAEMTYLQAISDALREELRADERVFLMGEDIAGLGGALKVTDG